MNESGVAERTCDDVRYNAEASSIDDDDWFITSRKHVASNRTLVSRDCLTCCSIQSRNVATVSDQSVHLDDDAQ